MIRGQVVDIIARATLVPVERLHPEARPEDLGIDSLGLVESIFALEEAFDIKVPFNAHQATPDAFDVTTIGGIVRGVEALVKDRQTA